MSIDRHILAVVQSHPVASSGVGAAMSSWAFWEAAMQRGTTVFTFLAAVGGFVLFLYNLRAARRKRRIKANLPCAQCGWDGRRAE